MDALLTGLLAGYGIAIPVGAIAVLIVEVGIRCGFRCAFFAGAGAATADFMYAGLAVVGGAALAGPVRAIDEPLRLASAVVLVLIAAVGLRRIWSEQESVVIAIPDRRELAATFARFVGLTIINPTTIVYFAAVIVGFGVADQMSAQQGLLFVVGAFSASLSWQTMLAALGATAGNRLGRRTRTIAVIVGNLAIVGFAIFILLH